MTFHSFPKIVSFCPQGGDCVKFVQVAWTDWFLLENILAMRGGCNLITPPLCLRGSPIIQDPRLINAVISQLNPDLEEFRGSEG